MLRQEYEPNRDKEVRKYIRRNLSRRLLMFAIDSSQRPTIVNRLYSGAVRKGFNELHAEVASAIEYAAYCSARGDVQTGLAALRNTRRRINERSRIPRRRAELFIRPLEKAMARFQDSR
jgi:hypothetical protein